MKTAIAVAAGVVAAAVVLAVSGCGRGAAPVTPPGLPKELVLDLGNKVTMKLVLVPAGTFTMGSPADEKDRFGDEAQHKVIISKAFYMGACEVTRGQFAAFIDESGYQTGAEKGGWAWAWTGKVFGKVSGASWKNLSFDQTNDHPVVCVSWTDAETFCTWLSKKSGKTVRLPTEAEWEYACRAGTKTAYHWGDDPDDGNGWCNGADQAAQRTFRDLTVFNWDDGFLFTAPAGQFKANAFGLCDMHGNVQEWCGDWYARYEAGAKTDPTGPATGAGRVARGGSWVNLPWGCRSAYRFWLSPEVRLGVIGFRVVVVP